MRLRELLEPTPPHAPPKLSPPPVIEWPEDHEEITLEVIREGERTVIMTEEDYKFYLFASCSDFKRAVYRYLTGTSWRGKTKDLEKTIESKIEIMNKLSTTSMGDVINEFKTKVKKIKSK